MPAAFFLASLFSLLSLIMMKTASPNDHAGGNFIGCPNNMSENLYVL
jgi:hypothetical protein